ncbi:unnamed protein product, partial [Ectocarpus sp. 4 AP-2014]
PDQATSHVREARRVERHERVPARDRDPGSHLGGGGGSGGWGRAVPNGQHGRRRGWCHRRPRSAPPAAVGARYPRGGVWCFRRTRERRSRPGRGRCRDKHHHPGGHSGGGGEPVVSREAVDGGAAAIGREEEADVELLLHRRRQPPTARGRRHPNPSREVPFPY